MVLGVGPDARGAAWRGGGWKWTDARVDGKGAG